MNDRTFKAAVLRKFNENLEIEDLLLSELSSGQVLVKNIYSGICRSQLMEIMGMRGEDRWLPHLLGHEGYGIVEEIGPNVTKISKGDLVILSWIKGTGIDALPPKFFSKAGETINAGSITTFSEYSIVSENRIFKSPGNLDEELMPLLGCAFLTGAGMVISNIREVESKKVAVIGFGGVGSAAAAVLLGMKPQEIVIIEDSEERRKLAEDVGFANVFKSTESINRQSYFDYCFESAGSVESIEAGWKMLNKMGTLVFASHPKSGEKLSLDPYELIEGRKIIGTWGGNVNPDRDISMIASILMESGLNLKKFVGQKFPLSNINEAIDYLITGSPGRPILDFQSEAK